MLKENYVLVRVAKGGSYEYVDTIDFDYDNISTTFNLPVAKRFKDKETAFASMRLVNVIDNKGGGFKVMQFELKEVEE
jgi:hypothetical protein